MSYDPVKKVKEYQQTICNIVCYVLWLYEKKLISERTKYELLKLCNPELKGESYGESKKYR